MIKIEKISATNATIIRGGVRQPVLLHSHINAEELSTIEAESGTLIYSVDEAEVKELTFQTKTNATASVTKQPATPSIVKPTTKAAKPIVESTSQENELK